jgi:uncharacterized C2H2 Zn-finger protein
MQESWPDSTVSHPPFLNWRLHLWPSSWLATAFFYVTETVINTVHIKYLLSLLQTVKKSNWRKNHEDFVNSIRAAREMKAHLAQGGKLSDLPPPPPSDYSDYVQCPHCSRRFNQQAAERHIPKCANYSFNKPKPPQRGKGTPNKGAVPRKRWYGNPVFYNMLMKRIITHATFLETTVYIFNSEYNFNRSAFIIRYFRLHSLADWC